MQSKENVVFEVGNESISDVSSDNFLYLRKLLNCLPRKLSHEAFVPYLQFYICHLTRVPSDIIKR